MDRAIALSLQESVQSNRMPSPIAIESDEEKTPSPQPNSWVPAPSRGASAEVSHTSLDDTEPMIEQTDEIEVLGEVPHPTRARMVSSAPKIAVTPDRRVPTGPMGDGSIVNRLMNPSGTTTTPSPSLSMPRPLEELNNTLEREAARLSQQARQQTVKIGSVTSMMVVETQNLLKLFGIPYVVAPAEAEAQCATLLQLGLVDAVATEDSDVFLFGAAEVHKNLFAPKKELERYTVADMETELGLHRDALIDYAMLVGSDYTEGVHGVGPVLALEILGEFKSATAFAEWWLRAEADSSSTVRRKLLRMKKSGKLAISDNFPDPRVRDAYINPHVSHSREEFSWGMPDLHAIRRFMGEKANWTDQKTKQQLHKVLLLLFFPP